MTDKHESAAHTPGPWSAQGGAIYGERYLVALSMGAGSIPDDEILANVRLIAAAPELLLAVQRVADWLSSFSVPPTSTIQEKDEQLAMLHAALALAGPRPRGQRGHYEQVCSWGL